MSWQGNTESYLHLQAITFLHRLVILKDEDAIFRFHETKKDDPIMASKNLLGKIINIHPFEDGNRRICRLILVHVLIQIKCCVLPVILSSFHRRGKRHYIRVVKTFDRNPSMLYHDCKVSDTLLG